MLRRCDYHTHTPLCHHAEGEPEAFVQQALALELSDYGIADHAPFAALMAEKDNWRMHEAELPRYAQWIERARAAAQGSTLRILTGFECDWLPNQKDWIEQLAAQFPVDYLLGSIHYIGDKKSVDDPVFRDEHATGSLEGDWALYWQRATEMVQSGLFDIYGHLDIIKIWGGRLENEADYYMPCIEAIAGQGGIVELNVAGWVKPCAEQYPSRGFLEQLLKRRIPICINSDCHRPSEVSRDWQRAYSFLSELAGGPLAQVEVQSRFGCNLYAFISHGSL